MGEKYLIQSIEHQLGDEFAMWWGPNRCGYTRSVDRAGRYTREEADAIVARANGHGEINEVAWSETQLLDGAAGPVERIVRLQNTRAAKGRTK